MLPNPVLTERQSRDDRGRGDGRGKPERLGQSQVNGKRDGGRGGRGRRQGRGRGCGQQTLQQEQEPAADHNGQQYTGPFVVNNYYQHC